MLTNWSKPAYNPIVEATERDPSTAWQTPAGEWRLTKCVVGGVVVVAVGAASIGVAAGR